MAVHRDAAIGVIDISCDQIQRINVGHAPRAVDDAIGFGRMFGAVVGEDHPQPAIRGLNPFHAYIGHDANSDTFALGLDARDGICVHGGQ